MKHFLVAILFLMTGNFLLAQSCKELDTWKKTVTIEFPQKIFGSLRVGEFTYNKIRYNLLSDKYFIPVFGESYENYALKGPSDPRLYKCRKKLGTALGDNLPFLLSGAFRKGRQHDRALLEVKKINSLRKEFSQIVIHVESSDISYTDLMSLNYNLNSKFDMLMPSELEHLSRIISEQQTSIANKQLFSEIDRTKVLNDDYKKLYQLINFRKSNNSAYYAADYETKSKIDEQIEKEIDYILNAFSVSMQEKIRSIAMDSENLATLNELFRSFKEKYRFVANYPQIETIGSTFRQKKTNIVSMMSQTIRDQILSANSTELLKEIQEIYFSNIDMDNSVFLTLNSTFEIRKSELVEAERERLQVVELKKSQEVALFELNRLMNEQSVKLSRPNFSKLEPFTFNSDDQAILNLVEEMSSQSGVYLVDVDRSYCAKIKNINIFSDYVSFEVASTAYAPISLESKIFKSSRSIEYIFNPAAFADQSLFQECNISSSPAKYKLNINQYIKHPDTNFPMMWKVAPSERYCSVYRITDNCLKWCWKYSDAGENSMLFVKSRLIAQTYSEYGNGRCFE